MKRTTNSINRSETLPFATQSMMDDGLPPTRTLISADLCLIVIGSALLLASGYKIILKTCRTLSSGNHK